MFEIKEYHENGFDKLILTDRESSVCIEIIPDCGAMLHAYKVKNNNREEYLNIIDSYTSKSQYEREAEPQGFKGLKLSPFPCRLKNALYEFDGKQYVFDNGKPGFSAIHGFLYNKPFRIITKEADLHHAVVAMQYEYSGQNVGYPFPYQCTVTYRLAHGNKLTVQTTVTNTGLGNMPVADGWHPYFGFGKKVDELQLQFQSGQMVEFENLVPTGKLIPNTEFSEARLIEDKQLDNSFVVDFSRPGPACILRDPASGWQLEIQPGNNYPYLQLYIPPHRNSIAIENLSAPPDAFNNGMSLTILKPGETVNFTTSYRVTCA